MCRFQEVAEMLDISNLMIEIKTSPLLSPDVVYGVHLVFKFSDSRKVSSKPTYVNLKFRKGSETLHSYFATWRDNDWMMIELYRFLNDKEDAIFELILESFSPYYCGEGAIYVEGIEYRAIHNARLEIIFVPHTNFFCSYFVTDVHALETQCSKLHINKVFYKNFY